MVVRPQKGRKTLALPLKNPEPEVVFDIAVFIGRFQPFHFGHLHIILKALECAKFVHINIGSFEVARRPDHNPWTAFEREQMIRAALTPEQNARVFFKYVHDFGNMPMWTSTVRAKVAETVAHLGLADNDNEPSITLIGHSKDATSFYLKEFSDWESIDVPQHECLSATPMREIYFNRDRVLVGQWLENEAPKVIPPGTVEWLKAFLDRPEYREMVSEWDYMREYLKLYESEGKKRGWHQFFVTVDNIVVHSGHVLLIQRKNRPGKDLWAFPGGFLNLREYIVQGSLRELEEETKIDVPYSVLRGSMISTQTFDNPFRSMRERTITHASLYHLVPKAPVRQPGETADHYRKRVRAALALPKIKAADDAKAAVWVPIERFLKMRMEMFEDHYQMGETMLALLPKAA